MIAMWVSISCPLQFTIAGSEIVLQEYLDQLLPKLLPLAFTLGIFACIKKKMKVTAIIGGIGSRLYPGDPGTDRNVRRT